MTITAPTPAPNKPNRPDKRDKPTSGKPGGTATRAGRVAPEHERQPDPGRQGRRPRSAAAVRAYARRAQREGQLPEHTEQVDSAAGRAGFVVLIIGLLVGGVAATLWLSTQAIADSYRLEEVKQEATDLSERAAALQREVTKMDSPSALAQRAKELGMVLPADPARLVVRPDGTIEVVGEPKAAQPPVSAPAPQESSEQPAPDRPDPAEAQRPQAGSPAQGAG